MKILILTDYFPPEIGGAAHLMSDLAGGLSLRGHAVSVATGMPRYNLPQAPPEYRRRLRVREKRDAVDVIRTAGLPFYGKIPFVRALGQFASGAAHFIGGLSAESFDVVFVLSPPLTDGVAAHGLRRLRGGAFVLNVQDIFPQNAIDLGILRSRAAIRFFEAMERFVYRRCDAIVVHSDGNRGFLVEKKAVPAERVVTVPNWVDTDAIRPGDGEPFRSRHGLGERFVVSFAGVMGWSQGLDVILDAAERLKDRADILFLLAGEGVEKPRLEEEATRRRLDNVRFLPMQPRETYPDLLAASDACLVTLHPDVRTPVVPSKILSAMAAARPAVASIPLQGDAPRLIETAGCGVCVPAGDGAALAGAIGLLDADRPLALSLGRNGRHAAETTYSLSACLDRYESLFRALADGRGAGSA